MMACAALFRPAIQALAAALLALLLGGQAQAERRLAFVVGVNQYPNLSRDKQLQHAVADAEAVGSALQDLGFGVTHLTQGVNLQSFSSRFDTFMRSIEPGDVVVFFFAGHGIAVDGTNYLIPADIPALTADNESTVRRLALAESDLVKDLRGRGARVTLMVIDACRENPFPRTGTRALGGTRGLARVEPPQGVFALYSAGAGQEALDYLPGQPNSSNSLFTHVFVEQLRKPISLIDLGESVRDEVAEQARKANRAQTPAYYNEISGARSLYLAGLPDLVLPRPAPVPQSIPNDQAFLDFIAGLSDKATLTKLAAHANPAVRNAAQTRLAALSPVDLKPVPNSKKNGNGAGSAVPGSAMDFVVNEGDRIFFSKKSVDINKFQSKQLDRIISWLKIHEKYTFLIEGHSDDMLGKEANFKISEKRAERVKEYMTRNGISSGRIRYAYFGDERPLAVCPDEACRSQNRRAVIVLDRGGDRP